MSGRLVAPQAAVERVARAVALSAGDTSVAGLACYRAALEQSFVLRDLRTLRRFPHFMESTPRMFRDYPDLARDVMRSLFLVDGTPMRRPSRAIPRIVRRTGYLDVDEYLGLNRYTVDEAGNVTFDHAGCLECGTCRIVAEGGALAIWRYPVPTMGVEYRFG